MDTKRWAAALLIGVAMDLNAGGLPDPKMDAKSTGRAVFAGGCFWCTEAVFEQVAGVTKVVSGYAGGDSKSANYEAVGSGRTKHAEAIEITYNPDKVTFGQLLKVFFSVAHDPTQLNKQGPDWGTQYRSAVFFVNDEQKKVTEAYIQQLTAAKSFAQPIVTQVVPLEAFYAAEGYHQDYVKNHPSNPYVVVNALPKLKKLKELTPSLKK
jgi:peptide-methionine (S)-S-oxide reductase